jgi:hypothetical protein
MFRFQPITIGVTLLNLAFVLVGRPIEAVAADIRPYISDPFRSIVIEGTIAPGDLETFLQIVRENQGKINGVYCFSPGGDFYEAMKIGRAMRALALSSHAPGRDQAGPPLCGLSDYGPKPTDPKNCTCASAGFFIHIGAIARWGLYLAVHRPYFDKGQFGNLSPSEAKKAFDDLQQSVREYMDEMGVPKRIQDDVIGTASDRALVLDQKTVRTYLFDKLPYIYEWEKNRCERLSVAENNLYQKKYYVGLMFPDKLSKEELVEGKALKKKYDEQTACYRIVDEQCRADAYQKYFGEKPTDFANHNFEKWSEATKYLGKNFYALMSEEKFEEDNRFNQTSLERKATADAPLILLLESETKRRVATVVLISPPYPSKEFNRRLVESLEMAWGKQFGGNATTEWRGTKRNFLLG